MPLVSSPQFQRGPFAQQYQQNVATAARTGFQPHQFSVMPKPEHRQLRSLAGSRGTGRALGFRYRGGPRKTLLHEMGVQQPEQQPPAMPAPPTVPPPYTPSPFMPSPPQNQGQLPAFNPGIAGNPAMGQRTPYDQSLYDQLQGFFGGNVQQMNRFGPNNPPPPGMR